MTFNLSFCQMPYIFRNICHNYNRQISLVVSSCQTESYRAWVLIVSNNVSFVFAYALHQQNGARMSHNPLSQKPIDW